MNLYVFRIAKGHEGGSPTSSCPDMRDSVKRISDKLSDTDYGMIPYESNNYLSYLHQELWFSGKLRQGWGIENLDLRQVLDDDTKKTYSFEKEESSKKQWIENYVLSSKKYWNEEISENHCHLAMGRYNILKHLKTASTNDLFFIPKHSFNNHHDSNSFTVCQLVGDYYFDLDENYKDFGHTIIVKNLRTFNYSEDTLLAKDFQGYQKAVSKISEDNDKKFLNFVNNSYLT